MSGLLSRRGFGATLKRYSTLREQLMADYKNSMIKKDTLRIDTLKAMLTTLNKVDKDKKPIKGPQPPLNDSGYIQALFKLIEGYKNTMQTYERIISSSPEQQEKAQHMLNQERQQCLIVESYLPTQPTTSELEHALDILVSKHHIQRQPSSVGTLMKVIANEPNPIFDLVPKKDLSDLAKKILSPSLHEL
jgi:uncharacterized protein YqeY